MNDRQRKSKELATAIQKMGGFVLNVLPLEDTARGLRVQILDTDRERILPLLKEWGWSPEHRCYQPRMTYSGMQPAALFEIDLPREQQPIADRTLQGEIAGRQKSKLEVEAVKRYLGIK